MTCLSNIINHSIRYGKLFGNQVAGEGGTRTPDTQFRNSKDNVLQSTAEAVGALGILTLATGLVSMSPSRRRQLKNALMARGSKSGWIGPRFLSPVAC